MTQFLQDSRLCGCRYFMLPSERITQDYSCLFNIAHFFNFIFGRAGALWSLSHNGHQPLRAG
jgi:hypothetical protein